MASRDEELGSVGLQASPVSPSPSLANEPATPSGAVANLEWAGEFLVADLREAAECARRVADELELKASLLSAIIAAAVIASRTEGKPDDR